MRKFLIILVIGILVSCSSDDHYKTMLLSNIDRVEKTGDGIYNLDSIEDSYYTEIQIMFYEDTPAYYIICWGDRSSILWDFRKDRKIHTSLIYDMSKGEDVYLDYMIHKNINNTKFCYDE